MTQRKYPFSLIISLGIHAGLIWLSTKFPVHKTPDSSQRIEFSVQETPPEAAKTPTFNENELPKDNLQVIEQDEHPVNEEIPEQAKFLSAHNQVVKRETVAQNIGDFKNRKENNSPQGESKSQPEKSNSNEPVAKNPKLTLKDLTPKLDLAKVVDQQKLDDENLEKELEKEALAKSQKLTEENLQKKMAQLKKQAQSGSPGNGAGGDTSQTNDFIKDTEKGMETMLSTREFVYYSFYARIRRQLNQHWGGKVREKVSKLVKEGRSIASTDNKITKLLIVLDKKGTLVKIQLLSDSGVRDLDDAAIEAFKEAAPFPNPPSGIVESDGTIKIRWDFILEA